jgi:hypothetical protein
MAESIENNVEPDACSMGSSQDPPPRGVCLRERVCLAPGRSHLDVERVKPHGFARFLFPLHF